MVPRLLVGSFVMAAGNGARGAWLGERPPRRAAATGNSRHAARLTTTRWWSLTAWASTDCTSKWKRHSGQPSSNTSKHPIGAIRLAEPMSTEGSDTQSLEIADGVGVAPHQNL